MNPHLLAFLAGFVGLLGGMLAFTRLRPGPRLVFAALAVPAYCLGVVPRLQGLAPGWETAPALLVGAVVGGVLGWLARPRDRE